MLQMQHLWKKQVPRFRKPRASSDRSYTLNPKPALSPIFKIDIDCSLGMCPTYIRGLAGARGNTESSSQIGVRGREGGEKERRRAFASA